VSYYCAAGLWKDFSLRILALPSLKEIVKQELPVKTLPRSLLFATFDEQAYLLVGLGDGQLLNYKVFVFVSVSVFAKLVLYGSYYILLV
jgi:DNA damage-binding protein 1